MNTGVPELQMSLSNVTAALSRTQIAFRPEGFDTALQTSTPEDRRCLSQNELRFKPESLRSVRPLTTPVRPELEQLLSGAKDRIVPACDSFPLLPLY